jgi:hypothetical protein
MKKMTFNEHELEELGQIIPVLKYCANFGQDPEGDNKYLDKIERVLQRNNGLNEEQFITLMRKIHTEIEPQPEWFKPKLQEFHLLKIIDSF